MEKVKGTLPAPPLPPREHRSGLNEPVVTSPEEERVQLPQLCRTQLKKPVFLRQQLEYWGKTFTSRGREETGKETVKTIKGLSRDVVPADCIQDSSRKFTRELFEKPHPRIPQPGLWAPQMARVLNPHFSPFCSQILEPILCAVARSGRDGEGRSVRRKQARLYRKGKPQTGAVAPPSGKQERSPTAHLLGNVQAWEFYHKREQKARSRCIYTRLENVPDI